MILSMVIYSPWEVPQINVNINGSGIFVPSRREEEITKLLCKHCEQENMSLCISLLMCKGCVENGSN